MIKTVSKWIAASALAIPLVAQASIFQFNASIAGVNEVPPTAAVATGVATLFYNDAGTVALTDDTYNFSMSVFGLTGGSVAGTAATAFHIHGAATTTENGPVLVGLSSAPFIALNSGSILLVGGSGVPAPTSLFTTPVTGSNAGHTAMSFLDMLKGGLTYVNVHTAAIGSGAVRGQLLQVAVVPEPETYGMLLAGLALIGTVVRRRKNAA